MNIDTESSPPLGNSPVVARRYAHDWALFADWCAACEHRALPADPMALAGFLHEHPAAAGTQRRRVTAINTVHADNGHPPPGRSETIRQMLSSARAERLERIAALARQRIPQIPVTGWTAGLFGRRDALILALAATGLGFEQIARLRRDEVTAVGDVLIITVTGGDHPCAERVEAYGMSSVVAYQNWIEILGFLDRYPSTRLLAQRLDQRADLSAFGDSARRDERPLLTTIDRWGHTPFAPTRLTGQSVAILVRAHLTGGALTHTPRVARPRPMPAPPETAAVLDVDVVELGQDYYERGIRARRAVHGELTMSPTSSTASKTRQTNSSPICWRCSTGPTMTEARSASAPSIGDRPSLDRRRCQGHRPKRSPDPDGAGRMVGATRG